MFTPSIITTVNFLLLTTSTPSSSSAMTISSPGNHLLKLTKLHNKFFALRHGQSLANVSKIISSDPAISVPQHGLSPVGLDQARIAGTTFAKSFPSRGDTKGVALFSSDFRRARETAEIVAEELKKAKVPLYGDGVVNFDTRLRERFFGELNGGPDGRYHEVWEVDAVDPDHNEFGVESVTDVVSRTTEFVRDVDRELSKGSDGGGLPWTCVLVAHGDVLQIVQTGFQQIDGSLHRTLPHLETATFRALDFSSE